MLFPEGGGQVSLAIVAETHLSVNESIEHTKVKLFRGKSDGFVPAM